MGLNWTASHARKLFIIQKGRPFFSTFFYLAYPPLDFDDPSHEPIDALLGVVDSFGRDPSTKSGIRYQSVSKLSF
ncbi:unnamed protein product [marine sediment metagenome]|uniref:Uncharacterized protein n=1 Tax=marine sediment metagenome TaxID=412755 RepID=X1LP44_9ZZZZ